MKNVLRLLVFTALVTAFALPALAQDTTAAPATGPCAEADAKAALYARFTKDFKGTPDQQKAAYEAGKEYLSKYGTCKNPGDEQITKYIQNWVGKYEEATIVFNCQKAANETPAQAFEICRQWIAAKPDDLRPHLALVGAGIKAYTNKDTSLNSRAVAEARSLLGMIESGKTTDTWAPFANQQDAVGGLRYYIAAWSLDANPDESATQLLKVAQSNSVFAKEPATFQLLGLAYTNGELKKLIEQYKPFEGKEETPESAALLVKINHALDRVIDSYARAVALANANPSKYGAVATALRPVLTNLYKQRHEGQETGLNELIAGVLNKPLPIPGQEPAPTPAPASNSGVSGTNGATPATAQPASGTTPPAAAPKPSATAQKPPRS